MTITKLDDIKKREVRITTNEREDIVSVELYFYCPIPIMEFSMERLLIGQPGCSDCGKRNQKAG